MFYQNILLHTRDGGANWLTNHAPFGNAIIAFGGQSGYAMVPEDPGAGSMPVTFHVTNDGDGAASWQELQLPVDKAHQAAEFSVESPLVLSARDIVLPVRSMTDTMETLFFASHDGGATWSASPALPGQGAYAFADANHGWFWDGTALRDTGDGGHQRGPAPH